MATEKTGLFGSDISLGDLLKTGTELGTSAIGGGSRPGNQQIAQTIAPAPATPAKPNYVLYGSIAGGVVLLVVVLVVLKK